MNKKLLLTGVVALTAGFFVFNAFDSKTRAQQEAEINQMVTMKLDELRAAKDQECTDKVNTEAQRRFDEIVAQRAAEAAATPGKKSNTTKKGSKGPKVDPLPTSKPADPSKDKWNPGGDGSKPSQEKWKPANPDGSKPPTSSPSKDKWGNPVKSGGGGK